PELFWRRERRWRSAARVARGLSWIRLFDGRALARRTTRAAHDARSRGLVPARPWARRAPCGAARPASAGRGARGGARFPTRPLSSKDSAMTDTVFISTSIPYVNGAPHVGFAWE